MNTSVDAFKLYILFQKVAMRMLLRKKTSAIISARGTLIVEAEFRILIIYWWMNESFIYPRKKENLHLDKNEKV